MTAQVFEFKHYRTRKAAEAELMNYLLWTLKHEFDPHKIYEDPIEVFRAEVSTQLSSQTSAGAVSDVA
jgi:hypothetical protein